MMVPVEKTGVPGGKTTVELLGSLISLSTLQCQYRKEALSLLQPNLRAYCHVNTVTLGSAQRVIEFNAAHQ